MKPPFLLEFEPRSVWKYFHEITQIPRPSGKESKILAWIEDFAIRHHLSFDRDLKGNLVLRKPAVTCKDTLSALVLQAHVDMVCEKNGDILHDFEKDPIQLLKEGGWVKARGTTLGADNGMGMAMMLAVLADPHISHGPLEALFTVEEETGLLGAKALPAGFIQGKTLINLDSEEEGEIYIGCAGGIKTIVTYSSQTKRVPEGFMAINISIRGLKGGHSGDDMGKGRGNAIKILVGLLYGWQSVDTLYLSDISGGNLHNAIPRESWATLWIAETKKEQFFSFIQIYRDKIGMELRDSDPGFFLEYSTIPPSDTACWNETHSSGMIHAMEACPDGVLAMSDKIEGLVSTSSNLAAIKQIHQAECQITLSHRSDSEILKTLLAEQVRNLFEITGATVFQDEGYPGWEPNMDSPLLKLTEKTYHRLFGVPPRIKAIHAGLECGLFLEKFPGLDMVSIGPTIRNAHSPDEALEIESVVKTWRLLKQLIESWKD